MTSNRILQRPRSQLAAAIALDSPSLSVTVDALGGGSIRSITDRGTATNVLFESGWSTGRQLAPAGSHGDWVETWPGGWHVLFPNAGEACTAAGQWHPFHGAASTDEWRLARRVTDEVVGLAWDDGRGLAIKRTIRLRGPRVRVGTEVRNTAGSEQPFVLVEHIVFSSGALGHRAGLTLPAGRLIALADDGAPLAGSPSPPRWPIASVGAEPRDWSDRPRFGTSRFGALYDLPYRRATIDATAVPLSIHLTWSRSFPNLWYWDEHGGSADPPWNGITSCVGIEPAGCRTSEGLAKALERGDAVTLPPGAAAFFSVEVFVEPRERREP